MEIGSFADAQLSLLAAELAAETAETALLTSAYSHKTLARSGLAILNLVAASQRTGPGGKTIVEFELDAAVAGREGKVELPEHGIRSGDIVGVREHGSGSGRREKEVAKARDKERDKAKDKPGEVSGVVVRVGQGRISVSLDKEDAEVPGGGQKVWIVKLANDVTYKRMNDTMRDLSKSANSPSELTRVLFGQTSIFADAEPSSGEIDWIDTTLNESQKSAIIFALSQREIALIHGPPGTGKTHTLIELIHQLVVKRNKRVLVCGPSNISVDNIVERLANSPSRVPMVRIGHPARLLPSVVDHSLDVLARTSDAAGLVKDIRDEMDSKQASIRKTRNGRERKQIWNEIRELRKEYRERERRCTDDIVRGSKIVLATLHGAGGWQVRGQKFDVVLIDEASQALEAACWVPLLATGCPKVVLAGDHLQLPPTIKSQNSKISIKSPSNGAVSEGGRGSKTSDDGEKKAKGTKGKNEPITLEVTMFDRLLELYGNKIKRMLTIQYRMHEKINTFPSAELYDNRLVAAEAVKARLLKDLAYGVEDTDDTGEPLIFYDTQGGDFPERAEDYDGDDNGEEAKQKRKKHSLLLGDSKSNDLEAALVRHHVSKLVAAGVKAEDIAVVTPYNAQLSSLSHLLREQFAGIELGSIDGFQGREKEAVILSLVRSNSEHEVGFLGEKRRLNVAMTRPKRHLCVIGDSDTVAKGSGFLKRWMAYLEEHADLRYPDVGELSAVVTA